MTDTTTNGRLPITRLLLTHLMGQPGASHDSVAAARVLDLDPAKCSSALSKGYESMANGWEYVHRSEKRPYSYWFDPTTRRIPAVEAETCEPGNVETAPFFEQVSVIADQRQPTDGRQRLLIKRNSDGTLWIARPFDLVMDVSV